MVDTKIGDLPTDVVTLASGDKFPIADVSALTIDTYATALEIKTYGNTAPVFAAGTASANTWPKLTSGTVLTTPEVGALELDANCFYGTSDAGNRGIIPVVHYIRAASAQTLTSQTAAQNIFDSPAGGALTLETGAYLFELLAQFTGMSATSGNGQILFGGTGTFADWNWRASGLDTSASTGIAADLTAYLVTNASAASVVTAGVGTALRLYAKGSFECSVAGTHIPQIALVTAAAATVAAGSYYTVRRIGAAATASIGQWA